MIRDVLRDVLGYFKFEACQTCDLHRYGRGMNSCIFKMNKMEKRPIFHPVPLFPSVLLC